MTEQVEDSPAIPSNEDIPTGALTSDGTGSDTPNNDPVQLKLQHSKDTHEQEENQSGYAIMNDEHTALFAMCRDFKN